MSTTPGPEHEHEHEHDPPPPTVVVAMGGHAFIRPGERGTYEDHIRNAHAICRELMVLVERGYRLVITHGNGPQVGDLLTRNELTRHALPSLPLDVLVAQTEGALGYYLQRALLNEMHARQIRRYVVTMVTQVIVSPDDPA
jgi:carbamate kinase